jgi:hypothetical protein
MVYIVDFNDIEIGLLIGFKTPLELCNSSGTKKHEYLNNTLEFYKKVLIAL